MPRCHVRAPEAPQDFGARDATARRVSLGARGSHGGRVHESAGAGARGHAGAVSLMYRPPRTDFIYRPGSRSLCRLICRLRAGSAEGCCVCACVVTSSATPAANSRPATDEARGGGVEVSGPFDLQTAGRIHFRRKNVKVWHLMGERRPKHETPEPAALCWPFLFFFFC
jgi:hypothetical protein